jgi:hypothetical protein
MANAVMFTAVPLLRRSKIGPRMVLYSCVKHTHAMSEGIVIGDNRAKPRERFGFGSLRGRAYIARVPRVENPEKLQPKEGGKWVHLHGSVLR